MITKFLNYILTFSFLFFSYGIFSQKLSLEIYTKDSIKNSILKSINFKDKHSSEKNIYLEINSISETLKKKGYFLNTIDTIIKKDSIYKSYFSVGKKTSKAIISTKDFLFDNFNIKNGKAEIAIENLSSFLTSISNELDAQGKSFSKVSLKNIYIKDNLLFADLDIYQSKERTIDKVIVKGYEGFSKSHIKHFLNINKKTIFNQQKLKDVSSAIASLNFISEIKPPEVLFSKDSTLLYIYIKKEKVNNFDGLLNFASKENGGGLLFNGHLDLKLNNILNTGEQFQLFWKANGEERQEFTISTILPYIFNSSFTPELSFKIYKQDSTFLNTKFNGKVNYNISSRITTGITYESEVSENTLQNNNINDVKDFENNFIGIQFLYRTSNNDVFLNDKFFLRVNPSFGNRVSEGVKSNQFKIDFETSYLWEFNKRSSFFIRNKTGYLNSDDFIKNELYRIGGANSIRGFNEQSIFISQFSYFNLEYRYLTSQNSYLYSITDLGRVKNFNANSENLYGLGAGYLFRINNSQINLGVVIGKDSRQPFDFDQSKLILKFVSYF